MGKSMFPCPSAYDSDAHERARRHTDIKCEDESLTQQSFAEDADINVLARRFGMTDAPVPTEWPGGTDGITSLIPACADLRQMLDVIAEGRAAFAALPADVRARFHNNPVVLDHFMQRCAEDEKSYDEGIRLGLIKPRAPAQGEAGGAPPAPAAS